MSLSKPVLNLIGSYLQNLYLNPIKTKSLTSAVIATSGNLAAQLISGSKFNADSAFAFGLFGLLFGGSVPHYFYGFLEKAFPSELVQFAVVKKMLFERLVYAPLFQYFSLYSLSRFEGKSHDAALDQVSVIYWPILEANWRFLTLFQVINLSFVPPVLRVLFMNLVGFFWMMFLAKKKRQQSESADKKQ